MQVPSHMTWRGQEDFVEQFLASADECEREAEAASNLVCSRGIFHTSAVGSCGTSTSPQVDGDFAIFAKVRLGTG